MELQKKLDGLGQDSGQLDTFAEVNEKEVNYNETEAGRPITQSAEGPFVSDSGNSPYEKGDKIRGKGDSDRRADSTLKTVWNKTKHILFNGNVKVQDASDVAHIMRSLENKAVENAFAVHVDAKGNSHIQFIGMGSATATVFDPKIVVEYNTLQDEFLLCLGVMDAGVGRGAKPLLIKKKAD